MGSLVILSADGEFARALQREARRHGWRARVAAKATQAGQLAREETAPVIVLDGDGLPDGDCRQVFNLLRQVQPLLIMVATGGEGSDERVAALELGADDAVSKRWPAAEIIIRVRSLRVHYERTPEQEQPSLGDGIVSFDARNQRLSAGGRSLSVTPSEARLLYCFLERPQAVVSNDEIAQALWPGETLHELSMVKVYVHRLRAKLRKCAPDQRYIVSVRAQGYRFR